MNKFLLFLTFGNLIACFADGLLGPLYAVFAEGVGGDILTISSAYAVFLLTMGILSMFVGKLTNHYSKRQFLILGGTIDTIATFSYLLVDNPLKLFIVQAMVGVAASFTQPTCEALFSMHLDKYKECEEWSLNFGGTKIIAGVALLLGGAIVQCFGFKYLFVVMGLAQLISVTIHALVFTQPVRYQK